MTSASAPSRIFVFACILVVIVSAGCIPQLWTMSQAWINDGHGLHPFAAGGFAVGLLACSLYAVIELLQS